MNTSRLFFKSVADIGSSDEQLIPQVITTDFISSWLVGSNVCKWIFSGVDATLCADKLGLKDWRIFAILSLKYVWNHSANSLEESYEGRTVIWF